jgi:NDP-sugar pyrophosphorylase family protein
MKAMLLAAGLGTRFRPVSDDIPKPLFPFLNIPLVRAHLERLGRAGVTDVGVNLHHRGEAVRAAVGDLPAGFPRVRFFEEPEILGTAGALRNAAEWLSGNDFFVVNSDAALEPEFEALLSRQRQTGRAATLLVTENQEPARFTPLASEGDRVTAFGRMSPWPLVYTGVCALSPRVLARIPEGERSLVDDLWQPMLDSGEEIGWLLHDGPFSDLGTPRDFLRATRQALTRGGPFSPESGEFDAPTRVLSRVRTRGLECVSSVLGSVTVGKGSRLIETVVWDGAEVGAGAELKGCIVAGGRVPAGAHFRDSLLWGGPGETASAFPLSPAT